MFAFSQSSPIIPMPQKSNEWYTPARYIEAAREVMGGIDLDPASCELANRTVKASRYYTQVENGLTKPWYGRVWLNPPYGANSHLPNEQRSYLSHWLDKLLTSYESGQTNQTIVCLLVQPSAKWFAPLWQYPICFADHNVRFFLPFKSTAKGREGRSTDSHLFGTCFAYLGANEHKFIDVFSQFGRIAKAIDTPRKTVMPLSLWEAQ